MKMKPYIKLFMASFIYCGKLTIAKIKIINCQMIYNMASLAM